MNDDVTVTGEDEESRFHKQRSRLMSVSVAALFLDFVGAHFRELSVAGASITMDYPERIAIAINVAVVYFFVRFWQYAREVKDLSFLERYYAWENWIIGWAKTKREYADEQSILRKHFPKYGAIKMREPHMNRQRGVHNADGKITINWFRPGDGSGPSKTFEVSKREKFMAAPRTFLSVCVLTRHFTDYWLPPVLALCALLYGTGLVGLLASYLF